MVSLDVDTDEVASGDEEAPPAKKQALEEGEKWEDVDEGGSEVGGEEWETDDGEDDDDEDEEEEEEGDVDVNMNYPFTLASKKSPNFPSLEMSHDDMGSTSQLAEANDVDPKKKAEMISSNRILTQVHTDEGLVSQLKLCFRKDIAEVGAW